MKINQWTISILAMMTLVSAAPPEEYLKDGLTDGKGSTKNDVQGYLGNNSIENDSTEVNSTGSSGNKATVEDASGEIEGSKAKTKVNDASDGEIEGSKSKTKVDDASGGEIEGKAKVDENYDSKENEDGGSGIEPTENESSGNDDKYAAQEKEIMDSVTVNPEELSSKELIKIVKLLQTIARTAFERINEMEKTCSGETSTDDTKSSTGSLEDQSESYETSPVESPTAEEPPSVEPYKPTNEVEKPPAVEPYKPTNEVEKPPAVEPYKPTNEVEPSTDVIITPSIELTPPPVDSNPKLHNPTYNPSPPKYSNQKKLCTPDDIKYNLDQIPNNLAKRDDMEKYFKSAKGKYQVYGKEPEPEQVQSNPESQGQFNPQEQSKPQESQPISQPSGQTMGYSTEVVDKIDCVMPEPISNADPPVYENKPVYEKKPYSSPPVEKPYSTPKEEPKVEPYSPPKEEPKAYTPKEEPKAYTPPPTESVGKAKPQKSTYLPKNKPIYATEDKKTESVGQVEPQEKTYPTKNEPTYSKKPEAAPLVPNKKTYGTVKENPTDVPTSKPVDESTSKPVDTDKHKDYSKEAPPPEENIAKFDATPFEE